MKRSPSAFERLVETVSTMTVSDLCNWIDWTPTQLLRTCERLREKAEPPSRRRPKRRTKHSVKAVKARPRRRATKREPLGVPASVGPNASKGLKKIGAPAECVAEDEADGLCTSAVAVADVESVGDTSEMPASEDVSGVGGLVGESFEVDGFALDGVHDEVSLQDAPNGSPLPAANDIVPVSRLRKKTVAESRIGKTDLQIGALLWPERVALPATRAECRDGVRPCPHVRCRYSLFLDVTEIGSIIFNHPNKEPWQLAESCALDVAERGGETLEDIGAIMNLTRERVRQVIEIALAHLRERGVTHLVEYMRFEEPRPAVGTVERMFGAG